MAATRSVISLVVVFAALLAACAPPGALGNGGGDSGPIKIGILSPMTGTSAASGKDYVDGWNLYWELNGNKIAGREVETYVEDEAGDPTTGVSKARLLVEQRNVDLLMGPLFAHVSLAVGDYADSVGIPMIPAFLEVKRKPVILGVVGWNGSQPHHPLGEYALEQGYRRVATLCTDYAFGHDVCGGFVDAYTRKGGQVVQQLWNPLGTPDYSSYLTQLQGLGIDAVFALAVGADAVRFAKQWNDFGMKGKVPVLGGEVTLDQSLLRSMGPEAEGLISVGHFAEGRPEKPTQEFVDAYLKKFNLLPSYYSATNYTAADWLKQLIEREKVNIRDRKAILDAAKKFKLAESAMGPRELDQYGNPISHVWVRKVERRPDGKLWNVPIKTYERVPVSWTWSAEEFLKLPIYSRTFQGPQAKL